ncbi:hypothetical protein BVRB_4g072760 [Beta vulgaris subsp. vulgaris]|nr:hypothetical protein BVRB_4g072760 [Beta vulgaris subsp. vulgaris]
MKHPINESKINKTSQQQQQQPTHSKEEDDDDYVLPCCNDDFVWPELSSSDDLSNPNIEQITICSVPTTPESPNVAISTATENLTNLGFSGEESPSSENEFADSGVEEEEETENVEEFSGDLEMEQIMRIRAKISTLKSKLEEDSDIDAVECLIEVMKQMFKIDMRNNGENVDILETVKSRGMTFPQPRGYDS